MTLIKLNRECVLDTWIKSLTNLETSVIGFVDSASDGRQSVSRDLVKCVWKRGHDNNFDLELLLYSLNPLYAV